MTSQLGESGQIPTSSGGALKVTGSSSTGARERERGWGGGEVGGCPGRSDLRSGSGSGGSEQVDLDTPGGGHGCSQVLEATYRLLCASPGGLRSARPVVSKHLGFSSPLDRVIVWRGSRRPQMPAEICPSVGWQLGATPHYWTAAPMS